MDERDGKRRVAIACQGGGSHTAFTAGVLKKLLTDKTLDEQGYEIVALSGTSGGAICAFLTWYALLGDEDDKKKKAAELLEDFWTKDNSAYLKVGDFGSVGDVVTNALVVGTSRLSETGFAIPQFNPYDFPVQSAYVRDMFKAIVGKRVDFDLKKRVKGSSEPMLFLGAANVLTGEFHVFKSHEKKDGVFVFNDSESDGISVEAILASAAVPSIFKAERFGEAVYWNGSPGAYVDEGVYWDGLYSQNPPLRNLTDADPDEIWVIQINPEEMDEEPTMKAKITDRQNELSGNLSLNQELYFVRKINELVRQCGTWDDGAKTLSIPDGKKYRVIEVRRIELSVPLYTSSKLDRSPSHIKGLMHHGEERTAPFLSALPFQLRFEAAWQRAMRDGDVSAVLDLFAEDAVVRIVPPAYPDSRGPAADGILETGDRGEVEGWLRWCLDKNVNIEQTRDYGVDGEKRTWWMLLTTDHLRGTIKGRAELVLHKEGGKDKISSFTFHLLTLEAARELQTR